jgi:hypothetical protein
MQLECSWMDKATASAWPSIAPVTLRSLLPTTPRSAFLRTFCLSSALGLLIVYVLGPLVGLAGGFGGTLNDGYLELATNLVLGHGYVFEPGGAMVLHRPPLYPVLLAPLTLLPPALQRPVLVLVQSVGLAATCALTFEIAARLFSRGAAQLAVGVLWLDPLMFWIVKQPMVFVLQGLLALAFVAILGRVVLKDRPTAGPRATLLLCVLGAALALTHGAMLASVGLLLGVCAFGAVLARDPRRLAICLCAGLGVLVLISPWTYRNWRVSGSFIPVVGAAGFAYFQGNAVLGIGAAPQQPNETITAATLRHAELPPDLEGLEHFMGISDVEVEQELNARMFAHVRSRPGEFARKVAFNALDFYFPAVRTIDSIPDVTKWGGDPHARGRWRRALATFPISLFHLCVWVAALVALWRFRHATRGFPRRLALLGALLLLILPYWPFVVVVGDLPQYTTTSMALLAILAGSAFEEP